MEKGKVNIKKLIVIGGSAGSLEVLLRVLPGLKVPFPYPVVIVLHRKQSNDNLLTELLSLKTKIKVKEIEDKDALVNGIIYLAPGNYHILFEEDYTFSLDDSERVNYSRPSIDVAFQSAADVFGGALTCILLSGANADGADGFLYVKERGGETIVQAPETAEVAYMPEQVIANKSADKICDIDGIANWLNRM
ncbi:MAG: chemotaxis protein CheB [Taibaiella sp.]|nr:chemotaxis protein CheB [Taibaiella sp.]